MKRNYALVSPFSWVKICTVIHEAISTRGTMEPTSRLTSRLGGEDLLREES